MEVFVEPIEAAPRLWLCGAGHVAQALAPLVLSLGFEVAVIDEREELNTAERFAGCDLMLCDAVEALGKHTLGPRDWVLIVTHDHVLDERALELALRQTPHYIGLVGSRRKLLKLLQRIQARSGESLDLQRLYAPVGLDLGAVGPQEIAISVAAELLALRRGRPAPHLRFSPLFPAAHAAAGPAPQQHAQEVELEP